MRIDSRTRNARFPLTNDPYFAFVVHTIDLPNALYSLNLACGRVNFLLSRFRGDTTIRGNDFVGIYNTDGGFVRSVLMFGVSVSSLLYLKLLDGSGATTGHFPAFWSLVRGPNAVWYPTTCDDGSWFVRFSTTSTFDDTGVSDGGFDGCIIINAGSTSKMR